jgi:transposase
MGIVRRHVQTEVDWNTIPNLVRIGLDEISLKKGHNDFVTIVSGYLDGNMQLLAVLKDRQNTVKSFLDTIPANLKKNRQISLY